MTRKYDHEAWTDEFKREQKDFDIAIGVVVLSFFAWLIWEWLG